MAVSPHPSVKPSKPAKPPEARQMKGESGQEGVHYGSSHRIEHHGSGDHKSEFVGSAAGIDGKMPKAGDE